MRLSTRVSLLLVSLTLLVAVGVGWFAVAASTKGAYATLDSGINSVVNSGRGHPVAALNDALYVLQQEDYDFALDVVDEGGSVTQINASTVPLQRSPTRSDVHASLSSVRTSPDLPGFRYRSLDIGGGSYLVVAGSTQSITAANRSLEERVALVALAAAIVMAVAGRFVTRREIRSIEGLIDFAEQVAKGEEPPAPAQFSASTDLQRLERSLLAMFAALSRVIDIERRTSETMQRFIGDASHELRTPLTVIKGYSALLQEGKLSQEQQQRALDRIAREVERIDRLVGDLLFLAEVREAPQRADEEVDLTELIGRALDELALEQPPRPIDRVMGEHHFVVGRRDLLERLVDNAVTNIVRYTDIDAKVRVTTEASAEWITLTIEDGGPGLPAEAYGHSPQRFGRFEGSRDRTAGGSGLGMSIMSDIAIALGGGMERSVSDLGGLQLRFQLPRVTTPLGQRAE
jgi:signal transduction histidine kinase